MYGDSLFNDGMVIRPSYLNDGNLFTVKMASLYWDGTQDTYLEEKREIKSLTADRCGSKYWSVVVNLIIQ